MVQKEPTIIRKEQFDTVITRGWKYNEFKYIIRKTDPQAFCLCFRERHILGRFVEE